MNNTETNIVLFDGECNFCNSTVLSIIKYDKNDKIRFASQQSEIGMKLVNENNYHNNSISTIILIKGNRVFIKTDALIEVCKLLVGFPRVFIVLRFIPSIVRDYFYDVFSKHRYDLFGKKKECAIPSQEIRGRFLI